MTGSTAGFPADRAATRVYVVDDHAMFRAGVRSELGGRVHVVGDAATVAEALAGPTAAARRYWRHWSTSCRPPGFSPSRCPTRPRT